MGAVEVVVIVVVLIALLALLVVGLQRRAARTRLQQRFGPEYDRHIETMDSRRQAERHLEGVVERRDALTITTLSPASRAEATTRWAGVQGGFVDDPYAALDGADHLVSDVMRERGYPVEDFEARADLVAADSPAVVEHYRAAHAIHREGDLSTRTTEDLREAFVQYRRLFDELVGPEPAGADAPPPQPVRHLEPGLRQGGATAADERLAGPAPSEARRPDDEDGVR